MRFSLWEAKVEINLQSWLRSALFEQQQGYFLTTGPKLRAHRYTLSWETRKRGGWMTIYWKQMRRSASEHVCSLTFRLHRSPFTRWWPRGQRHWLFCFCRRLKIKDQQEHENSGCHHLNNTAGCRREKNPFWRLILKIDPPVKWQDRRPAWDMFYVAVPQYLIMWNVMH